MEEKTHAAFIEVKAVVASNLTVYHRVMAARSAASQEAAKAKSAEPSMQDLKRHAPRKKTSTVYA